MSDRSSTDYRHGVPNQVTTMQPDRDAAQAFYGGVFGWDFRAGAADYLVATLRGRPVAAIAPLPPMMDGVPPSWVTNVQVDDVDAAAAAARSAGGQVVAGPFDLVDCRQVVLADPTGGVLAAWTPAGAEPAGVVNEPGAWAMSSLSTPDPDAAAPFYAAVFGWTTETIDFGGAEAAMFRLPGYHGGEPSQPVSRETVATMMAGDEPAWGLDFWVDDAEAAAARVDELGGTVVVPPFDTPVGRTAVVADPAGATFTITRINAPA